MEWRGALREAASVLWPVSCSGCGAVDVAVCPGCCALLFGGARVELLDGVPCASAADYDGEVRAMLRSLKEFGARAEARALGAGLAVALRAVPSAVVVRVPSSGEGLRTRGFDPVALLTRAAGVDAVALRRTPGQRRRGAQKTRSVAERAAAAHRSLWVPPRLARQLADTAVVVVDDVVTSGATVREAVRALREAGCRPVGIAAVARTQQRVPKAQA